MSDFTCIVLLAACCAATFGLVAACGRLMPREGKP